MGEEKEFLIIYIFQNNADTTFLIAPLERSVQELIESIIILKSIFRFEGPFSRIASHIVIHSNCYMIKMDKFHINYINILIFVKTTI